MGQSRLGVLDRARHAPARMRALRRLDGFPQMRDARLDMLAGLLFLGRIGMVDRIDGVLDQRRRKVLLAFVDPFGKSGMAPSS